MQPTEMPQQSDNRLIGFLTANLIVKPWSHPEFGIVNCALLP